MAAAYEDLKAMRVSCSRSYFICSIYFPYLCVFVLHTQVLILLPTRKPRKEGDSQCLTSIGRVDHMRFETVGGQNKHYSCNHVQIMCPQFIPPCLICFIVSELLQFLSIKERKNICKNAIPFYRFVCDFHNNFTKSQCFAWLWRLSPSRRCKET